MKPLPKRATFVLSLLALLCASACNRTPAPAPAQDAAGSPPPAEQASARAPQDASQAGFDIASVPLSNATLGAFPYLGMPTGYHQEGAADSQFERVPFWTGDRLEWVEGRVHGARVVADDGHAFSQLELARNMQALIASLGGQQIFSGRIPAAGIDGIQASKAAVDRVDALGDIYNEDAEVYVIRRQDRNIWIHIAGSGNSAGLLIAETKPLDVTAKALPADELKKSIETTGRVAIQVQFDTDQANILPASKPQLEQVVTLLNENTGLHLSINGHTDNTGDAQHNLQLSQRRAAAVRDFIITAGIDEKRLESRGFGDTQPIADNTSEEGKARNRRVELVKS